MSDPYRRLLAGDRQIPAAAINAAIRGGLATLRAKGGVQSDGSVAELPPPATEVNVKWTGTEALPVRSVVTYADTATDLAGKPLDFSDSPVYEAGTPAASSDAFAILLEPCRTNKCARAVSMGHAVVDIDITDESHTHANATPGETAHLTSATSGRAEILHKPDGTGVLRCTVLLGGGGGSGCEGGICTDYYTARQNAFSPGYGPYGIHQWGANLNSGQAAIVWPTATAVGSTQMGHPSPVVSGSILGFLPNVGFSSNFWMGLWARLVAIDPTTLAPIAGASQYVPLNHIVTVGSGQWAGGPSWNPDYATFPLGPVQINGSSGQGSVVIRREFPTDVLIAWQILFKGIFVSGGGYALMNGMPVGVAGIGNGPTYILVQTSCGACSPQLYTDPGSVPPPPPAPPSNLAPVASFNHDPQIGAPPLAVSFVDTSANTPTSWSWDFGDGSTSNRQHPQHTYTAIGTYTVTLTATNAYGSSTATGTVVVTKEDIGARAMRGEMMDEGEPPTGPLAGKLIAEPSEGNTPLTVLFRAAVTGGSPPYRHFIDFGDGTGTDQESAAHEYTGTTPIVATLRVTDSAGVVLVGQKTIVVASPAEAAGDGSLTALINPIFGITLPYTAHFVDMSSTTGDPILNWYWTFGDGGTSTTQDGTHTYPGPGVYYVTLTVSHATDSDTYEADFTIP